MKGSGNIEQFVRIAETTEIVETEKETIVVSKIFHLTKNSFFHFLI